MSADPPFSQPPIRYLAYGSNLHPARLAERVPSARPVGLVELPGYRLAFHKRGQDRSGKCLIYEGQPAGVVFGAVYELDPGHKAHLDRIEGLGRGYLEKRIHLSGISSSLPGPGGSVYLYAAQDGYVDPNLAPYHWYKEMVLAGARHHGLPRAYISQIEAVESVPDPDVNRARRNEKLLRGLGAG